MLRPLFAFLLLLAASAASAQDLLSLRVATASVEPADPDDSFRQVDIRFDEASRVSYAAFTAAHVNRRIVVWLDGRAVSPPITLHTAIDVGEVMLPPAPAADAAAIVRRLSSDDAAIGIELLP